MFGLFILFINVHLFMFISTTLGFGETMLPRSELLVPVNEELWEELRTEVDAKIPLRRFMHI